MFGVSHQNCVAMVPRRLKLLAEFSHAAIVPWRIGRLRNCDGHAPWAQA
jgi:hypothetical protein